MRRAGLRLTARGIRAMNMMKLALKSPGALPTHSHPYSASLPYCRVLASTTQSSHPAYLTFEYGPKNHPETYQSEEEKYHPVYVFGLEAAVSTKHLRSLQLRSWLALVGVIDHGYPASLRIGSCEAGHPHKFTRPLSTSALRRSPCVAARSNPRWSSRAICGTDGESC